MIRFLDHVNVRTAALTGLVQFYEEVLGLKRGDRPDLGFPGAWLYAGERAVLHLVGVEQKPPPQGVLSLEHFAFAASGLSAFLTNLERLGVPYQRSVQVGTGSIVINLKDPDGNRLHVDFPAE